jgi:hypothetical protein
MPLIHRVNTTAADMISNISATRFTNITEEWGGYANDTVGAPNWGTALFQIVNVYPDFLGQIAWLIIFLIPFAMMWVGHADVVPAATIAIFFGIYIVAYVGNQYFWMGIVMSVIGISTVLWSLYQRRV